MRALTRITSTRIPDSGGGIKLTLYVGHGYLDRPKKQRVKIYQASGTVRNTTASSSLGRFEVVAAVAPPDNHETSFLNTELACSALILKPSIGYICLACTSVKTSALQTTEVTSASTCFPGGMQNVDWTRIGTHDTMSKVPLSLNSSTWNGGARKCEKCETHAAL